MKEMYDLEVTTIEGKQIKLALYQGKVILIVNVRKPMRFHRAI